MSLEQLSSFVHGPRKMAKKNIREELFILPPGSPKTFSYDDKLPSLPLPTLKQTLDKYIESVRPFVDDGEFLHTQRLVRNFEQGIGKELHAKLLKRATNERNWVEKWWESQAYLSIRQPLIPHCSMMGVNLTDNPIASQDFTGKHKLGDLSLYMHHITNVWLLLRTERLKPTQGADGTHFSMSQFKRLFNTSRVPGIPEDCLVSYFRTDSDEEECPKHIIVMCRGRMFAVNMLDANGNVLNPDDWEARFEAIEKASHRHEGPGVGILSCDDRDTWAKNRAHLASLSFENKNLLTFIDSAMCVVTLDIDQPTSNSDIATALLAGDFSNRWADKSLGLISFKNGNLGGLSDHTAYDGMISVTSMHYCFLAMKETTQPKGRSAPFEMPTEVSFHLDQHLRNELQQAKIRLTANHTLVVISCDIFSGYGKKEIQAHRFHPDTFIQMAMQLGYYRLHKKLPPTYETATTRKFYNGRTETVRTCTVESVAWVYAMLEPNTSNREKLHLLKTAMGKHDQLMNEARENAGCDRHLFGLYCIAAEEGLAIPDIYADPAYAKSGGGGNFALSSSLVGYTPLGGGVAPMCRDGYGIFYNMTPERIYFSIFAFRDSSESSACKLFANIARSLEEMMAVLISTSEKVSKL